MTEPITTQQLAVFATAIDSAAEERGWNHGDLLVRLEAGPGHDEIQLGLLELDVHPLERLLGFTAPDEWQALGVCCEGWAASLDSGTRPSRAKGRMRVRHALLVSRDGLIESGLRLAGGEFEPMPGGEGALLDALQRALRLPTAPPQSPITEWLAVMLFVAIVGDHGGGRRVGWSQLRPILERYEQLGDIGTWDVLRRLVAKGHDLTAGVGPDEAAWMDDGMFSRHVLAELPPYPVLLERARRSTTPEAFTQVRRLLRKWGLRTRLRRAA
jgi:hypothetical protein